SVACLWFLRFVDPGVRLRGGVARLHRRSGGNGEVIDVAPQRLAALVLDLVLLAFGRDVDRRAVERGADLAGQERAVVVRVVPGEAALVARFLPERRSPPHGLERRLAVELGLALAVTLGRAEVPQHRITPGRRVTESVAERLTDRLALLLESRPELTVLVERLRWLVGAGFLEPGLPIGDEQPGDAPRHREELLAVL